jgi:hypothetical protein
MGTRARSPARPPPRAALQQASASGWGAASSSPFCLAPAMRPNPGRRSTAASHRAARHAARMAIMKPLSRGDAASGASLARRPRAREHLRELGAARCADGWLRLPRRALPTLGAGFIAMCPACSNRRYGRARRSGRARRGHAADAASIARSSRRRCPRQAGRRPSSRRRRTSGSRPRRRHALRDGPGAPQLRPGGEGLRILLHERSSVRALLATAAARAARFAATGSVPAFAWPFTALAASRAASGECDAGFPMVTLRVENRFPLSGSVPRGL